MTPRCPSRYADLMRYRLRTLLILLAILPPLLWFGWTKYEAWRAEQERQRALERELSQRRGRRSWRRLLRHGKRGRLKAGPQHGRHKPRSSPKRRRRRGSRATRLPRPLPLAGLFRAGGKGLAAVRLALASACAKGCSTIGGPTDNGQSKALSNWPIKRAHRLL